jgi:hypothetical protein
MVYRMLAGIVCIVGCLAPSARAVPITYDFTAKLDQPINGTSTISGTFSHEKAAPGFEKGTLVSGFGGAGGSLTIAGQTFLFQNDFGFLDGHTSADHVPVIHATFVMDHDNQGIGDAFTFSGVNGVPASGSAGQVAAMGINLLDPTGKAFPPSSPDLPTLNFGDFATRQITVTMTAGGPIVSGTITSFQAEPLPAAVPEPSALAICGMIGLGWCCIVGAEKKKNPVLA